MKPELTPAMQRRLAKQAAAAASTPKAMLPYVMEDGFEYNEEFVRKVNEAIAQADAGDAAPSGLPGSNFMKRWRMTPASTRPQPSGYTPKSNKPLRLTDPFPTPGRPGCIPGTLERLIGRRTSFILVYRE